MEIQAGHELLLKLLRKHPDFTDEDGTPKFKMRTAPLSADELQGFSGNETHAAVELMLTALNIRSGSVSGRHNFYNLLHAYLCIPACRSAMDLLASQAIASGVKDAVQ